MEPLYLQHENTGKITFFLFFYKKIIPDYKIYVTDGDGTERYSSEQDS